MEDFIMSQPSMDGINLKIASISTMIIVTSLTVLFFVLALCFVVSLYARWHLSRTNDPFLVSWGRRASRQGPPSPVAVRRRGLNRATLRSLPVVVYEPKDFKEGLECSVCLSETSQGEIIRLLPKCNHGFHLECIDKWFQSHSTCPLCRNFVVSSQNQSSSFNQETEVNSDSDSDSGSDSDSESDNDHDHEDDSIVHLGVALAFPTNVLFWGNEVQFRSLVEAATTSQSNIIVNRQRNELVIEIPRDLCDNSLSTPPSTTHIGEEEAKTPVVSRLRSLKRFFSRGARVAPWSSGSTSGEVEPF